VNKGGYGKDEIVAPEKSEGQISAFGKKTVIILASTVAPPWGTGGGTKQKRVSAANTTEFCCLKFLSAARI
jgi:hypothetical protein